MKRILNIFSVFILASIISNAQSAMFYFYEDFENQENANLWTAITLSGNAVWTMLNGLTYGNYSSLENGNYNMSFYSYNYNADSAELISPTINLSNSENLVLSFYLLNPAWSLDQDTLKIYYRINPQSNWTLLAIIFQNIESWTEFKFAIPDNSETMQIKFTGLSGYGYGIGIDNILLYEGTNCDENKNVLIENVKETSARISWSINPEIYYTQIEYGVQGFSINSGIRLNNISHDFADLNNLTPDTDYEFYLRTVCLEGASDWQGPYSFRTDCLIGSNLPYIESFENPENPLECWQISYANSNHPADNQIIVCNDEAYHGTKSFRFSSIAAGNPYDQYLISPLLDLPANTELSFYYKALEGSQELVSVGFSSNSQNSLSSIIWISDITDADQNWKQFRTIVPENAKYLVFHYKSVFQYYFYIDKIRFGFPIDCTQPTSPQLEFVAENFAVIDFTIDENTLFAEFGAHGFTKGQGTIISLYDSTSYLTNLNPFTEYDVYLVGNCEGMLIYSNPLTFTTKGICPEIQNIHCASLTYNKAVIQWDATLEYTTYNLEYGISGFEKGTGTLISGSYCNNITLTSLTPETTYDVYVQAFCQTYETFSNCSEVFTFTTPSKDSTDVNNPDDPEEGDFILTNLEDPHFETMNNDTTNNFRKIKTEITLINPQNYFCNQTSVTTNFGITLTNIDSLIIPKGTEIYFLFEQKKNIPGIFFKYTTVDDILPQHSVNIDYNYTVNFEDNYYKKYYINPVSDLLEFSMKINYFEFTSISQNLSFENNNIITSEFPVDVKPVFNVNPNFVKIQEIIWSDNYSDLNRLIYYPGEYNLTVKTEYCSSFSSLSVIFKDDEQNPDNNNQEFNIEVYPNPDNSGYIIHANKTPNRIQVFDSAGKQILDVITVENFHNLITNNYAQGIYYVKVFSNNETMTTKVFIE
jgi:hypothetical protein